MVERGDHLTGVNSQPAVGIFILVLSLWYNIRCRVLTNRLSGRRRRSEAARRREEWLAKNQVSVELFAGNSDVLGEGRGILENSALEAVSIPNSPTDEAALGCVFPEKERWAV